GTSKLRFFDRPNHNDAV
ncbi:hypothetical protein D049_0530B, partial [Vibrio parahaemolyticus VPTS-2010]